MWGRYKALINKGILSINQRNRDYVLRYNKRRYFPLVDNKLLTKNLAIKEGIAIPKLYAIVDSEYQIKKIHQLLAKTKDFVIKPAHGAGGDGIIIITEQVNNQYRQINGHLISHGELEYYLSRILSGAFSLGGHGDSVLIEQRVIADPIFHNISYEGVPDIRIITLLGYPAMAMARLPTRQSSGKANLHQGAIGVGICLATGKTSSGVFNNAILDYHPDTLASIVNIELPQWKEILYIAARCYEMTGLGYLGVDIVLDKNRGPLVLELNARPGLNIQIANRQGGLLRYRKIEERAAQGKEQIKERVAFSQCF